MCNDIELFNNLIMTTSVIPSIIDNTDEHIKIATLLEEIKDISDYQRIDNPVVKQAIKEVLENERFISIIKNDTKLDVEKIREMVK